ncbi:hypothetical protein [Saccharothrix hoggarensis]|uniref:Nickel/cobalt efflux system n=1 Tax=Saccharothrix hoggarensis TaxID=913853 RepID=A0ABW3QPI0_9PSEU
MIAAHRAGTARDAVAVGAAVTLTHTAGVLVLCLLVSATSAAAGGSALRWLGGAAGLLVVAIGVGMLLVRLRDRLAAVERLRDRFTALPTVTAVLVPAVGAGLTLRAAFDL